MKSSVASNFPANMRRLPIFEALFGHVLCRCLIRYNLRPQKCDTTQKTCRKTAVPIYEYQCESCSHRLEKLQKMSEAPLTECPACGASSLKKLVSAAAFRLKGGGWYETDFKTGGKKNVSGSSGSDSTSGSSGGGSDSGSSASASNGSSKTSD